MFLNNKSPLSTFACLLSKPNDLPQFSNRLPTPIQRGDATVVKIEPELHKQQFVLYKTNLIGRIILRPGSKTMKLDEIQAHLQKVWQPSSAWHLIPLARGFFDIHFNDENDMRKIWGSGTCVFPQGVFRLYQWQPNFNPYEPKIQSHSQVWIWIYGLNLEYWHPRILLTVARGLGIPLQIDQATKEKRYGYCAKMLVKVDLSGSLPDFITVELPDYGFNVEIHYENLPAKCNCCNRFGHTVKIVG